MKTARLFRAFCLPTFCLLAAAAAAGPAYAQWSFDVEAAVRRDSNLNNARAGDALSDNALVTAVAATRITYLENGDSLSWGGRAATEAYARFSGLNKLALGAFADFRHKLGLGPYAPWWRAGWSSTHLNFDDAARDGWQHEIEFATGKRLDERWNLSLNYRLERRTARTQAEAEPGVSGDAFSGRAQTLTLAGAYAASATTLLSASGFARYGDVVSISGDDDRVLAASKAAAHDNVFGADRYAYRLNGFSSGVELGAAMALGPRSRLALTAQWQATHAAGGNIYAKNIETLTWTGSF